MRKWVSMQGPQSAVKLRGKNFAVNFSINSTREIFADVRHREITCEKYLARVINEKHKIATLPWKDSGKNRRTIRLPTSITDM